ncbi:MAG: sigma 54-interacting transcriptional regulator [Acidobacteriota bacterium]
MVRRGAGGSKKETDAGAKHPFSEHFSSDRFETILNSISDGVFAIDLDYRLTCFNAAAERILGRKRWEVLGEPCSEVIGGCLCEESSALGYTFKTGQPVVNLPLHLEDAMGRKVHVTVSTSLIRDRKGRILGAVVTFRDLHMVKRLLDDVGYDLGGMKIITVDDRLKRLLDMIPMIAKSESTVLISGESGTGKGLLARTIHAASDRRDRPMVTVNCGALPEPLLESELFGYKAGAFTDAKKDKPGWVKAAEGGTLFFDEIGELPLPVQVKILHLLQEKRYQPLGSTENVEADVRIVTATNRNLPDMMNRGLFREDLFYRINVIPLVMPPLRERKSDIPLLADSILRSLSMARGKLVDSISSQVLARLMAYDYPGNVRELENILEHAYVMSAGPSIEEKDLPQWFISRRKEVEPPRGKDFKSVEAKYLLEVLAANRWNRTAAARQLGIHVTTLHRKLKKLGITLPPVDGRSHPPSKEKDE